MSTPQNPLPPAPIGRGDTEHRDGESRDAESRDAESRDAESRDAAGSDGPQTLPPASGAQPTHVPRANAAAVSGRESGPVPRSSRGVPPAPAGSGLDAPGGPVPVVAFEDERPASEHLGGARSDWERRAEWLESEAKSHPDLATRNRLLLAASEVRALLGSRTEARRLADQAASPATPGLAARQARALALGESDISTALRSLQEEARAARLPATRAHAYYLIAELLRLRRREDGESEQRLEAAEQSDPTDHRATLQRLVRQLASTQRPPDVRFRPDESLKPLRQATGQLRQLRGSEAPRLGPNDLSAQPLLETQRALGRGRLAEAADALGQLEAQPGLSAGVHFLATLWRVLPKSDPEELLGAVRRLAQRHPGRLELRTWAGRALAQGARDALGEALTAARAAGVGAPGTALESPAFSRADRAALAALSGAREEAAMPPGAEPELRPLQLARERASGTGAPPSGSSALELELELGRAVVSGAGGAIDALLAQLPETPWTSALRLERDRTRGDRAALARDLLAVFARLEQQAELKFFAGVLAEKAGDPAAAQEHLRAALSSPGVGEAALRALLPSAGDGAALLRAQAARVADPTRRALLLTEALLCMEPETPDFDAIAEQAWQADPELPWAADLGEVAARMRGDRAAIGRWLSRQRERSEGSADAALSSIREARFLALSEPTVAAESLRQLERPERLDLALRDQIEALAPGAASERVEFRLRAAAQASARGRERLLAEVSELEHAQGNTSAAVKAARELSSPLGRLRVEAWARDPEDLAWLSAEWSRELDQIQEDAAASVELLERLARLDRERGAGDRARIWRQRLLEQGALPVATLRFLAAESMLAGSESDLERCAARLAEQLGDSDALAQLFLAVRLRIDRGGLAEAAPLAERASAQAVAPLWGLRSSSALARSAGDDRRQLAYSRELRERARQPLDAATLSLRAAEAAGRLNELEVALTELGQALEIAPEHVVALSMRAELLERQGRAAEAAEAFETLAATSQCQPWRVEALYRAALLWLDRMEDHERALAALEEAAAVGLPHAGVQERLRALRPAGVPESDASAPAIDTDAPELARALELRAAGQIPEARAALEPLLARRADHVEALHLAAALLLDSGEAKAAERRWRQIEALPLPRAQRLRVLRALADLYEGALPAPERARRVYREILAADAEDDATRRKLVKSASAAAQPREPQPDGPASNSEPLPHELAALRQEAILQQRELMLRAADDDQRRQTLLDLVPLLEHSSEAQREAQTLLEQAHRTWPESPQVLEAQVEHYRRLGNANTARVLIERALHGARNAVLAGRLEPALFRTLEQAARLGDDAEGSRLAQTALAALEGRTLRLSGAGARAGQQRFDDLIAPAPLSSAFRRLLYGAGTAIERAYAADASSMNLTPMPESQAAQVRSVAAAFGLQELRVAISDEVGCDCVSLHGAPTLIVFGRTLLAHENPRVRDFLLLRSLKIAQVNACALSRMSATELWSAVAGFLACFSSPWRAEGQDAQRLVAARNRIRPHVTATLNRELTAMTAALTSNIVPQAAQLGDALWRWASRVALFGVGELGVALDGLAAATTGRPTLPKDLEGRIRWIAASSSARDLVGYGISEAYTEARRRAGLIGGAR